VPDLAVQVWRDANATAWMTMNNGKGAGVPKQIIGLWSSTDKSMFNWTLREPAWYT